MKMQDAQNQNIAQELNYEIRTYNGLTKLITQTKNRYSVMYPESDYKECGVLNGREDTKGNVKSQGLEQIKGRISRNIGKLIKELPIWNDWLEFIPGIGPAIAGELIQHYYFKFVAVCKDCDTELQKKDKTFWCPQCNKSVKGEGNLRHKVELRDFPTISSWWHFMGRHNDADGRMPKRKAGTQSDWSSSGRVLGFQIREQFNRQNGGHKYKAYAEKRKRYREMTHPDIMDEKGKTKSRKGLRHNMAWNETVKLFLSHFWQVAREIEGLPLTDPWCVQHGGHDSDSIIPPYYWEGNGNEPNGE